ncbi:MAG: heavy metal translocating P-type ATPase [Elusimicrobia bacterium]|nr:heavy metal translocating P-type ATPase [Elusimicrobiota bacterium]
MDRKPLRGVSPLRLAAGLALALGVWVGALTRLSPYSSLALAYLLAFVGARPFARGFRRSLATGRADADMLVIFGVWAALAQATAAVFFPDLLLPAARRPFFEVLGALVVFPALGRRLEELLAGRGGEALWRLSRRIPTSVRLVEGGGRESMVSVAAATAGARFRVMPGEHIPLDGAVVEGRSRVDESLWTGRGAPIEKSAGSRLLGGSLNKTGVLTAAAAGPAADTRLSRLIDTVSSGVQAKSMVPGVADQLAASYAPGVLIVAVVAALAWASKGPEPRQERAVTTLVHVLVAACPWTFGLAAPAALAAGLRRARRMGLKVRNPAVLQALRPPDVVVVGKTGVLSEGRPEVTSVESFGALSPDEILSLARAAGTDSGHPYAEAVARRAAPLPRLSADSVETHPGHGVSGIVGGRRVLFGALPWIAQHGISPGPAESRRLAERTDPVVGVAVDGVLAGVVALSDPLRPRAAEEVKAFAQFGVSVVLASGDREAAVRAAAEAAGITRYFAEVEEEQKLRVVTDLQAAGKRVAMVGSGFLDAPALSRADLGIALEGAERARRAGPDHDPSGFDLAAESADLVVGKSDLASLLDALRLATRIREAVRENLTLAFVPQLVLLPVAAGVFGPSFGVVFQPSYAAVAAAVSGVAIAINSIRRLRL